jgi:hypothetical protein
MLTKKLLCLDEHRFPSIVFLKTDNPTVTKEVQYRNTNTPRGLYIPWKKYFPPFKNKLPAPILQLGRGTIYPSIINFLLSVFFPFFAPFPPLILFPWKYKKDKKGKSCHNAMGLLIKCGLLIYWLFNFI